MSGHVHTWEPAPGYCGEYRCACGATAYRDWSFGKGKLREHIHPRKYREPGVQYVRSTIGQNETGHKLPAGSAGDTRRPSYKHYNKTRRKP